MSDLKPCPFCGRVAKTRKGLFWYVQCTECPAELGANCDCDGNPEGEYSTEGQAVSSWNTRATLGSDGVARSNDGVIAELTVEQVEAIVMSSDKWEKPKEKSHEVLREDALQKITDELNDAWNSRAEHICAMIPSFTKPATLDDCQEFCCSACGEYMVLQQFPGCADNVPNYCPYCGARRVDE